MSGNKILTGFKLDRISFNEICKEVDKFRDTLAPLVERNVAGFIASKACYYLDFYTINHEQLKESPLSLGIKEYREREQTLLTSGQRDPSVDNSFDLVMFPSDVQTYGIYFTEQTEFGNLWMNTFLVTEFNYYKKEEETEEWRSREDFWNSLLKRESPEMNGCVFHCVDKVQYIPSIDKIVSAIPNFDLRVSEVCLNVMFLIYSEQNKSEDIGKTFFEFSKWLKTDIGNNTLKAKKEEVSARLKKDITADDLSRI